MEQVIHSALHKNGAASRLTPKYLVLRKDHLLQSGKRTLHSNSKQRYNTLPVRLLAWQKTAEYKSL